MNEKINELKEFVKENNLDLTVFMRALRGMSDISQFAIQQIENDIKDLKDSDQVPEIARKYLLEIINSSSFNMSMFCHFLDAIKKIQSNIVNTLNEFEKELK